MLSFCNGLIEFEYRVNNIIHSNYCFVIQDIYKAKFYLQNCLKLPLMDLTLSHTNPYFYVSAVFVSLLKTL